MAKKLERAPLPMVVFLVEKVGLRDATKVAQLVVAWGRVAESLGRAPKVYEYGDFWKLSQATCTRQMRLFHQAYPDEKTPQRVWESVRKEVTTTHREMAVAEILAGRMVTPE